MGRLVVTLGSFVCLGIDPARGAIRLGKSPNNDIVLPLPEVADHHATIEASAEGWILRAEDQETLTVNGRPTRRAVVTPGDTIAIGAYRLRVQDTEETDGTGQPWPRTRRLRAAEEGVDERDPQGARLAVIGGANAGLEARLDRPVVVVGRAPDCDLILTDDSVSWRHVSVECARAQILVRDLGSSNGTFLGRRRIEAATVIAGDRIRIGESVLEFGPADDPTAVSTGTTRLVELVGASAPMRSVYERIREAARSLEPVLLEGETGTGKELAARALHTLSPHARGPFVPFHCATIPRDSFDDELFGPARGAFGRALGGTILLDEISELPLDLQPKLLRVFGDGSAPERDTGGAANELRVIATSSRDLRDEVAAGRFRRDLYYRLAVLVIRMPPLRDRLADVPFLVDEFLTRATEDGQLEHAVTAQLTPQALERLAGRTWPGNVRELRNVILGAVARTRSGRIDEKIVDEVLTRMPTPTGPVASGSLEDIARAAIRDALRDCNGHRRAAARRLGIAESTLYLKIKIYGLEREGLSE